MSCRLAIVIPCYNEQEALPVSAKVIKDKLASLVSAGRVAQNSRILLVNDGSRDDTWGVMEKLHEQDKAFSCLKLTRNRGHQNALLAGLMQALSDGFDATISMDADLQDDIHAMDRFLDEYEKGCDVVYGVRNKRETDTAFKRQTALMFYRLMKTMGADVVYNHADYRLLSRRALEALSEFQEVNLFLRGLVPLVGFKSAQVFYDRGERVAGESKYPLKKMLAFAVDGITSLSIKPIRIITGLGLMIFLVSLIMLIYTLVKWISGATVTGWTSTLASIWFIGGIQLLSLGVIGEYIGKVYNETKRRPRFQIDQYLSDDGNTGRGE